MRIIADANILIRALADDDDVQSPIAREVLERADLVALTIPALCEFVWVMTRSYKEPRERVVAAIRTLIGSENVKADVPVVEAGLALFEAGGDFADGAIAHEGKWLGGDVFVSFDRKAVGLLQSRGVQAHIAS
ncbi:type II toxin-antitoxin system VapC family toxin [Sphingomonas sp. BIUV-7]|uniref:Type II toxin-antitoxin system VapC family toxin n=1 Tax=Sphingomonas natans TaxID=3063330 RepID=A0ABT8YAU7_9SPHN|nr:type II toxin-antitoxin system VapC family toxin [Sphingomonas sp. BIUV-7]MDO6415449.1 type II toxin-antitoxin system VapC family toxin [Sphingomonas sp. BIUV-7]